MNELALYLCDGIEEGRLDYLLIFSNPRYTKLKTDVDSMLIADGFQAKIVSIV